MLQDLSVSVSCRLYVSVLQAQTFSHVAGYLKCQRFAGCHNVSVLQALTVSVCCTH